MTLTGLALAAAVKARALAIGFDAVAIGPATPAHGDAFARWLDAGYAGSMQYLHRTRAERMHPARLLPGVRAAVTVALSYHVASADAGWRRVARYARGLDYHDVIRPRLEALAAGVRECAGAGTGVRTAVDTSAVLERDLAARGGLGWIGKNGLLLSGRLGSDVFLGVVLTTAPLAHDGPVPDRCGTCRACLDACPTRAFVAPYVLDARRCISYLTIEHRGDVDESLAGALDGWLFGCDVCQDVCPWNRKAAPATEAAFAPRGEAPAPEAVVGLDEGAFRARFRGTAILRARRAGLARNAVLALARTARGDDGEGAARARATALLTRALDDPDPSVRRTAARAHASLGADASRGRM